MTRKMTRPLPAQFYSASEADAYAWFRETFKSVEDDDTEELADEPVFDFHKLQIPLFAPGNRGRTVEPPFFKDLSFTSQGKPQASFTLTRIKGETSKPDVPDMPKEPVQEREEDDDPDLALADMDYQFKKWTHSRREGVTCIPFAVAKAPSDLHDTLAEWRAFPDPEAAVSVCGSDTPTQQADRFLVPGSTATFTTRLTPWQQSLSDSGINMSSVTPELSDMVAPSIGSPSSSTQDENAGISKRAAMIAKQRSKAISSTTNGVLTSPSASQKRSMQQKNRNRKPFTYPKPEASSSKTKPEPYKPDTRNQQVLLRFDDNEESKQSVIQTALNEGLIDADNDDHVKGLMSYLNAATARKDVDKGKVSELKVIEEVEEGEDLGENEGKTKRLKGKARIQAKKVAKK